MSWAALFDRAAAFEVTEAEVRAALARRRADEEEVAGEDETG